MIRSFRDGDTEAVWNRRYVKSFSKEMTQTAYNKLVLLNSAGKLSDLLVARGNRLEKLTGNRAGQHSIRINDQWRICFTWKSGDAEKVEIVDYH